MTKKRHIYKIMPALLVVLALSFGVRFSTFVREASSPAVAMETDTQDGILEGAELSLLDEVEPAAGPESSKESPPPPSEKDLKTSADSSGKEAQPSAPPVAVKAAPTLQPAMNKEAWRGPDDLDDDYSEVKEQVFADLARRRRDLETREKEMAVREALLKTAQTEMEQKYKEMKSLKKSIEDLLARQNSQEEDQLSSVVKIYEGMKPKDAARIFNTLDMDLLVQVIMKMSERKSAPIIAAMEAEKARNITLLMAETRKLPVLSQGGAPKN